MSRLTSLKESELHPETVDALAAVKVNGQLAEVYLQFANSEPALRAYLHMEASIGEGSLDLREEEALKLWLSQKTGCEYCLSVHSFKARKANLTTDMQLAIRRGKPCGDENIDCLLQLAAALFQTPGKLDETLLAAARAQGFSDQKLVDLCMVMSTIFFTNIVNHINDSVSPLPPAPVLA